MSTGAARCQRGACMARTRTRFRLCQWILVIIAVVLIWGSLYLALYPDILTQPKLSKKLKTLDADNDCLNPISSEHRLGVVIPFRDRFEELLEFVPSMHDFLCRQGVQHKFFVVNQIDSLRFNRGALINIGFLMSEAHACDYIVMHDVDLIPLNDNLSYSYPSDGPFHIASPKLHPKYHYKTFVGGILLINNIHFRQANGLSNNFWGWGREDDEFFQRMTKKKLKISRPEGIKTGNKTFKHLHDSFKRARDYSRYGDQKANTKRRDLKTGVDNVDFSIESTHQLHINGSSAVTVFGVSLNCNIRETPWCMAPNQLKLLLQDLREKLPEDEYKEIEDDIKLHQIEVNV